MSIKRRTQDLKQCGLSTREAEAQARQEQSALNEKETMMDYTHEFHEAGNGFPDVGDEVLIEGDCGWHKIKRVASISPIHTRQWQPNMVYLTLDDADRDYDDLSADSADAAWEDLHHVILIQED